MPDTSQGTPIRTTLKDGSSCGEDFWFEFDLEAAAHSAPPGRYASTEIAVDGQAMLWDFIASRFGISVASRRFILEENTAETRAEGDLDYWEKDGGIWLPSPKVMQDHPAQAFDSEWKRCPLNGGLSKLFKDNKHPHWSPLVAFCGTLLKQTRSKIVANGMQADLGWGVALLHNDPQKLAMAILGYYRNAHLRAAGYAQFLRDEWVYAPYIGLPRTEKAEDYNRALDDESLLNLPIMLQQPFVYLPIYRRRPRVAVAVSGWGGVCDSGATGLETLRLKLVEIEACIRRFNELRKMAVDVAAEGQGIAADLAGLHDAMVHFPPGAPSSEQTSAIVALEGLSEALDKLLFPTSANVVVRGLPKLQTLLDSAMGDFQAAAASTELMGLLKEVVPVRYGESVYSSFPEVGRIRLLDWISQLAARFAFELANRPATQDNLGSYLTKIPAAKDAKDIVEFTLALTKAPPSGHVPAVYQEFGQWRCASIISMTVADLASKRFAGCEIGACSDIANEVLQSVTAPFRDVFKGAVDALATTRGSAGAPPLIPREESELAQLQDAFSEVVERGKALWAVKEHFTSDEGKEWSKAKGEANEQAKTGKENAEVKRDPGHFFRIMHVAEDPLPSTKGPLLGVIPGGARNWSSAVGMLWGLTGKPAAFEAAWKKATEGDALDHAKLAKTAAEDAVSVMKFVNRLRVLKAAAPVFAETGAMFWIGEAGFIIGLAVTGVEATKDLTATKSLATQLGDVAIMQGCLFLFCGAGAIGGGTICVTIGATLLVAGTVVAKRKNALAYIKQSAALLQQLNRSEIDVTVLLMAEKPLLVRLDDGTGEKKERPPVDEEKLALSLLFRRMQTDPGKPVHRNYQQWFETMQLRELWDNFYNAYDRASFSRAGWVSAAYAQGAQGVRESTGSMRPQL